ncbi:DUF664 domain-containing protein [Streptomyces sp. NPDC048305]|uniref:mycothiol transferase n=1 Tax=Streptomyces sp. NPDC048305 TaxID=3365532 RepID=UPI003723C14C
MTSEGMEKKTLSAFLAAQRASVLAIVDGLDTQALTSSALPSGWTPLGLVEHLGHAERHWFQEVVTGAAEPLTWPDAHAPLTTPRAPGVEDLGPAEHRSEPPAVPGPYFRYTPLVLSARAEGSRSSRRPASSTVGGNSPPAAQSP